MEQNRITGTPILAKRILSDFIDSYCRILQSPLARYGQVFRTVPTPEWFTLIALAPFDKVIMSDRHGPLDPPYHTTDLQKLEGHCGT